MTEDVSPEVANELYAEAVRQNRREWLIAVPVLMLAIVAAWFVVQLRGPVVSVLLALALAAGAVGRLALATWRLRGEDAFAHRRRDLQEEHAESAETAQLTEHIARTAAVKPVATYSVMAAICVVTLVEFGSGVRPAIEAAGLVKPAVRAGEWWRLLTATYLHGSAGHLVENMTVLFLLGSMIETYERRLRVPLVYLAAAIGGSIASTLLTSKPSVGASGGIMGLAGYLFILGTRQPSGAPAWIRKHMLQIFAGVTLIGLLGFFFIDNAGHLGGVLTGMVVGLLVIPGSSDAQPANAPRGADVLGWIASVTLVAGAIFTLVRLTHAG